MDKPKKKEIYTSNYKLGGIYSHTKDGIRYYEMEYYVGYNHACKDWEKYLAIKEEADEPNSINTN